jgi:hypothetical protein
MMRFIVNNFNVIAHNNSKIIGKLNVSFVNNTSFYINNISINKDFRGNNYGYKLLSFHEFHFNHLNIDTYKLHAINLTKDYKLYNYYKQFGYEYDYDYKMTTGTFHYDYDEIIPMKKKILKN